MKKVFKAIYKDWKISYYIISAITFLLMIAVVVVSQVVKKPKEVREIFSAVEVVSGLLFVWGMIFCSKDTIHGYAIGLCTTAFFSYGLYEGDCFGSFVVAMLICAYLIFKLVFKCLGKELDFGNFEKWDYLFLFGGLAVCAYPVYMLMDVMIASCIVSEVLVVLAGLTFLYLQFKKVKWSKFVALAMTILSVVSLVMILLQLNLKTAGVLIAMIMMVAFMVTECVKMFVRKKEIKQD